MFFLSTFLLFKTSIFAIVSFFFLLWSADNKPKKKGWFHKNKWQFEFFTLFSLMKFSIFHFTLLYNWKFNCLFTTRHIEKVATHKAQSLKNTCQKLIVF